MIMTNVLVLTGDGLNCENETHQAFKAAGAQSKIMHINALLKEPQSLDHFDILAIPGGFSFGDEINSGQILALKIRHGLKNEFEKFINNPSKLIIGICNGFQTLCKLGAFNYNQQRSFTLSHNRQAQFINRWSQMSLPSESVCIWTKGIKDNFQLPIRHAEGRICFKGNEQEQSNFYQKMQENRQIALTYSQDENGSYGQIAGLCDKSGRIFGLMPHPEAAINQLTNPTKKNENKPDIGLEIFKNAVHYIKEIKNKGSSYAAK